MQITLTLQASYTGATYVAGPFNISGTTSEGTTYELASGVTKSSLTTGYSINTVHEDITGGTINSTGTCSTSQIWTTGVGGGGGEPTGDNAISVAQGTSGRSGTACYNGTAGTFNRIVYHPTDTELVDGHTYFNEFGVAYPGAMGYYSDGIVVGRITNLGYFTQDTTCTL
jgi:hypothetical protein